MDDIKKTSGLKRTKLTKAELLYEIQCMLKDFFVAQITEEADGLVLEFSKKQKFKLKIERV